VTELAAKKRDAVLAELTREIRPGHEMYGQVVQVEAFFEASDDVIVRLVDGTFARTHPGWSGRPEPAPFPTTKRLGNAAAASAAIKLPGDVPLVAGCPGHLPPRSGRHRTSLADVVADQPMYPWVRLWGDGGRYLR